MRRPTHILLAMRSPTGLFVLIAASSLLAGCPAPRVARPYPPPTAAQLIAHLDELTHRAHTLRTEAKVDYFAERGERVKVSMVFLVEPPEHLRIEADSPLGGSVASLATDGTRLELLDVRSNRFLAGPAEPCNVARLIQVALRPADVVAVLMGSAPLPTEVRSSEVSWDGRDGGREVLTLHATDGSVATVRFDARDRVWDVLSAERKGADGKLEWQLKNGDFGVRAGLRLPGKAEIEQPARKADVRVRYDGREANVAAPEGIFQIEPPPGLPAEEIRCP